MPFFLAQFNSGGFARSPNVHPLLEYFVENFFVNSVLFGKWEGAMPHK